MEESLLVKSKSGEKRTEGLRWVLVCEEVKRLGCLAAPMVAVIQSQNSLQAICLLPSSSCHMDLHGQTAYFYSRGVSNELGAGNPQKARLAVYAVVSLAVTEAIAVSTTLFASRHVFGYIFSDDEEVVDYVTNMAPLLCGHIPAGVAGPWLRCERQFDPALVQVYIPCPAYLQVITSLVE
ncbi:Protein detoxification 6 [Vitis vinifera]|uniref:Protein detoxification 6 n=1 Tax=Vitis vinifera TaxID=29760 RepID=A0A438C1A9_VITVI|nr:Protein detoxification 6 [Vitis vinifera]